MLASKENDSLLPMIRNKFYNNPGFFEGIVDAIQEFYLVDFIQLHMHWNEVSLFLRSYAIDGMAVTERGKLVTTIYPFEADFDVQLGLYVIVSYLK